MFQDLKGFAQFISVERGLMVLMISVGASFLMGESLVWFEAVFLGVIAFCIWSAADAMNNIFDVDLDVLSDPFRAEFTKKLGKLGLFIAMFFTALSLLLGAFFLSLGIFFSGFCKDQIVAFVATLLACFAIFLVGTQFISGYIDGFVPGLGSLLGQIAAEVHSVERLKQLVTFARQNLAAMGYENIFIHQGDGTLGWPAEAPYDAIVVAAGGPEIPQSLKQQLLIGGRLVMPVGSSERRQHLICLTREDEIDFRRANLGAVAFVPLIGEEGWQA